MCGHGRFRPEAVIGRCPALLFAYRELWNIWSQFPGSVRLGAGEPDHFAPLLGFLGEELSEFGRRDRQQRTAQIGEPRLQPGIGTARINLAVSPYAIDKGSPRTSNLL